MHRVFDSSPSTTYNWVWQCVTINSALRRWKQGLQVFKVMSIYVVLETCLEHHISRPCLGEVGGSERQRKGKREGRMEGETEGLEVGLTARTGICEGMHMLAQGTKVGGGRNICTRVPLVAVFSRMVLPFHSSLVPAAESQCQSKSLKVLP